ncbi:MAG: response regulator transcription factor [Halothermotrichaceae bacterium]
MAAKILIVEDEKQISRLMDLELSHEGYQVAVENSGKDGLQRLKKDNFDLLLLDIMLPELDGIEVCQQARKFTDIPIIMVTAKDAVSDKVEALDIGADDYITKPFAIEELLARIRALLRRENNKAEENTKKDILKVDNLLVDLNKYKVTRDNKVIDLTKKEYDLLVYLLKNKGIVLKREDILSNIWGYDYYGETNIVDVYIRYLRSKIDDPFENKLVNTVRGVGYVLKDDEE